MARPLRLTKRFMLKLEPELLAGLDAWCATAGMKRSEAVRLAIKNIVRLPPKIEAQRKALAEKVKARQTEAARLEELAAVLAQRERVLVERERAIARLKELLQ